MSAHPPRWTPALAIPLGLLALLGSDGVNGSDLMLPPRVRAPLTVVGMPVTAEFRSAVAKKGGSGPVQRRVANGKFYRNGRGDTWTEYYADERRETLAMLAIWYADRHESVMVSFGDRTISRTKNPSFPSEQNWLPGGRWTFEKTSDQRVTCGLSCNRVLIRPLDAKTEVASPGESWVSFEWGLVMLDVEESQDQESRWEIISVRKGDPDPSLFQLHLPPNIVESPPSQ